MILPLYVDKDKDSNLIEWLNSKTNRSSFIRLVLYEKMKEDKYLEKQQITNDSKEISDSSNNNDKYLNSFF